MGRSWGYFPYGKPSVFCRIRPQSTVVICTVYIFRSAWDILGRRLFGEKWGSSCFSGTEKIQIISHNFRLWRFCFSSSRVLGVSCEERNGVYLRCTAMNDRTKVTSVLKRLGIDFLKMFSGNYSYQGVETSLYTTRHVLIKSHWKRYVSLTLNLLRRDDDTVSFLILYWNKVLC